MVREALRERFLDSLEAAGGHAGNTRLRETLGWQDDTYWAVHAALIDEGTIETGRGRGGSVNLCRASTKPPQVVAQKLPHPVRSGSLQKSFSKDRSAATKSDTTTDPQPAASPNGRRNGGVVKKSDLYSSLWASCDELRGGMDASQYRDYVLFMLFIKYVSDKYGDSDDFAPSVVIPPGASFKDMIQLKGKSDIGERINTQIIQPLIEANTRLARTDFPDFDDPNKLGEGPAKVERLTNMIAIFENPGLDFSKNRAEHDDILGDAYEYLMRHFATESGKSKGQFLKKPRDLLEYVIVHEMAHLIEPTHSDRFIAVLSEHYPTWREARVELNELPLTAEVWDS